MRDLSQDEGFLRASMARWRQQKREEEAPDRLDDIEQRLEVIVAWCRQIDEAIALLKKEAA